MRLVLVVHDLAEVVVVGSCRNSVAAVLGRIGLALLHDIYCLTLVNLPGDVVLQSDVGLQGQM